MNEPFYRVSDDGTEILQGHGEQESGILSISECREPDQLTTMCDLATMMRTALDNQAPEEAPNTIAEFVNYAAALIGNMRDTLAKAKSRAGGQWHQELVDLLNETDNQARRLLSALGTEE